MPLEQVDLVAAARLKGPHPFPLERLLGICWALLDADAAASEEEAPVVDARGRHAAEVFVQIRTLVSLRLLNQVRTMVDGLGYGLKSAGWQMVALVEI